VELDSDALIDATDPEYPTGSRNPLHAERPIDSQAGEYNNLTVTAGTGNVEFNSDIGSQQALNFLDVTSADGGVVFGASDVPEAVGDRGR